MSKKLIVIICLLLSVGVLNADSITKAAAGKDIKAILVLKDLTTLFSRAGSVGDKFNPGSSAMVEPAVGMQIFGDPMMKGIDKTKPVIIGFLSPEKVNDLPGFLCLPLSDTNAFSASSKAYFEKKGAHVEVIKGYAVVCEKNKEQTDLLKTVSAQLMAVKPADVDALAVACFPMDSVKGDLDKFAADAKNHLIAQIKSQPGADSKTTIEIVSLEVDYLLALVKQANSLRARINIEDKGFSIAIDVEPVKGTKLEAFIQKSVEQDFGLTALDTPDTAISGVFNVSTNLCREFFLDMILKDFMEKNLIAKADQKKVNDLYNNWLAVSPGQTYFKIGVAADGAFTFMNLSKVTDNAQARKLVLEGMKWYQGSDIKNLSNSSYMQIGDVTFKKDSRKSGSIPVDSMNIELKYDSKTLPFLKKIYGSSLNYEFAVVKDFLAITQSKNASAVMDQAIKQVQALKKSLKAKSGIPAKGLFIINTNLIRSMRLILNAAPPIQQGQLSMFVAMAKGLLMTLNSDEDITLTGRKNGNNLRLIQFIPYDPFLKANQAIRGMYGNQPGGGDAPPPQ